MDEPTPATAPTSGIDIKLARGLARRFGSLVDKADGEMDGMFKELMGDIFPHSPWRGRGGGGPMSTRRLKPEDFNRGRLRFERRSEETATALSVESRPMARGTAGAVTWMGISRDDIDVAWRGGNVSYEQWVLDFNRIDASERRLTGLFWVPPVVIDHHIIERIFFRTENADQGALRRLLGAAAQAAAAVADVVLSWDAPEDRALTPDDLPETDVVVPLPVGGALVGGVCLSNARPFRRSVVHQFTKSGYHVAPCSIRGDAPVPVIHLKTYMDPQILDPEQRDTIAKMAAHIIDGADMLRLAEPGLTCCPLPGLSALSSECTEWRDGLTAVHEEASATFNHWRRRSQRAA